MLLLSTSSHQIIWWLCEFFRKHSQFRLILILWSLWTDDDDDDDDDRRTDRRMNWLLEKERLDGWLASRQSAGRGDIEKPAINYNKINKSFHFHWNGMFAGWLVGWLGLTWLVGCMLVELVVTVSWLVDSSCHLKTNWKC